MTKEPVMSLVLGLIAAAGVMLTAFGVNVTPAQTAAIGGFAVAALALGLYVRSRVTPDTKKRKARERGLTLLEVLVLLLLVLVVLLLLGYLR
jgi:hypothetical protein